MSTQDDILSPEEQAEIDQMETESPDQNTEEPQNTKDPLTEDTEPSTQDQVDDSEEGLTQDQTNLLANLEKMTPEDRVARITKIQESGDAREWQKDAVNIARDIYSSDFPDEFETETLEETEEVENVEVSEDALNEALEQKLSEMGLTTELVQELNQRKDKAKQKAVAENFSKDTGINVDMDKAFSNKSFVTHYYDQSIAQLPPEKRAEFALYKTFGGFQDPKGVAMAQNMAGVSTSSAPQPKGVDYNNPDWIDNLDINHL